MNTKLDFVCDIIVGRSVNGPTELRARGQLRCEQSP